MWERSFVLRSRKAWFGGKSRVAHLVWERFGNVRTYVEPFFGSGAVLLRRQLELPTWSPGDSIETVCDADPYVTNFWRATSRHSDRVAVIADYPVHEADLHARHQWLVDQTDFRDRMLSDPDYFDTKIAAWWVWGLSCWIGAGWCCFDGSTRQQGRKRPDLQRNGQGLGVHGRQPRVFTGEPNLPEIAPKFGKGVHRKRPVAGSDNLGRGVHRQIPRVNALGGQGTHGHRVAQKIPNVHWRGAKGTAGRSALLPWFRALRDRLRPVRFVCGDFERITGKSVVLPDHGFAGLNLDPPYPSNADRHEELYSVDDGEVAHRAHEVALEWGSNPRVRVAFCGYEGSHIFPDDWETVAWKATGGYGAGQGGRGERNSDRERIWFSSACLLPTQQLELP